LCGISGPLSASVAYVDGNLTVVSVFMALYLTVKTKLEHV